MTKLLSKYILILYFVFPCYIFSQEVTVTSEADQYAVSGKEINGSITVTHSSSDPVDDKSFKLGDAPLKVEFLKEVMISSRSNIVISIYNFLISPQKSGLQTLPPVSVKVGGKTYVSQESYYDVN